MNMSRNETYKTKKLISKNIVLGSFIGIFLDFLLPACDCAVVSKMFIKKKASLNVKNSFMFTPLIINLAVLLLTLISLIFITIFVVCLFWKGVL